jgi:peptidoglycan/LPS O-acetylase OafA/YrhL
MTTLHAVNAIRVIAEYLVVRLHTFSPTTGMNNFVTDLMSFFFVLSGFVMMHSHYSDCFATTSRKWEFWFVRWKKIYPVYILNYAFYFHLNFVHAASPDYCPFHTICSMMQIVALNPWFGCGISNVLNPVNWYIATLAWIWLAFPFMHGTLKTHFSTGRVWPKMFLVNALATAVIYPLSGYEIFTFCTLPILRLGEFIIGCGAACALYQLEPTEGALTIRQWAPMALILVYMAALYTLFALPHGLESLCVHEQTHNNRCSLWETSKWIEAKSPCLLVWDKYINKHAFLWAVLIHTVAAAEMSGDNNPLMRLLTHDLFKSLNAFSLSLYLAHGTINCVMEAATDALGWSNFWHDDTRILAIYALCYLLHLITLKLSSAVFKHAYAPVPSPTQV